MIKALIADDKGQGTVEYILILSLVVVGTTAIVRAIRGTMDKGLLYLGGQIEKDLKTGRAPLNVWKN